MAGIRMIQKMTCSSIFILHTSCRYAANTLRDRERFVAHEVDRQCVLCANDPRIILKQTAPIPDNPRGVQKRWPGCATRVNLSPFLINCFPHPLPLARAPRISDVWTLDDLSIWIIYPRNFVRILDRPCFAVLFISCPLGVFFFAVWTE